MLAPFLLRHNTSYTAKFINSVVAPDAPQTVTSIMSETVHLLICVPFSLTCTTSSCPFKPEYMFIETPNNSLSLRKIQAELLGLLFVFKLKLY